MGGGRRGDSDEEAQTPDMLSALVKVSSLKNEINKLVMENVREQTVKGEVSVSSHSEEESSEGERL